ncbi:MAG: S8 family serine peptidase [Bacteroidetes bacterium]|nr:S8 family serine peptidase [Bacteroidota bacterium]
MRLNFKNLALVSLLTIAFVFPAVSQNGTNKAALEQLVREQNREWKKMEKRAQEYARENQLEIRQEFEDGTIIQLVDVVDGQPVYYKTDNLGAAITTRASELWSGGSVGVIIEGEGYENVGVWDGGKVRNTHQEFNQTGEQRIILGDNASSVSAHATHVSGTIIAGGVNSNAHGMAPLAKLKTHDWNSVEAEMASAAAAGMEISNHSWGMIRGWNYNNSWEWNGNAAISPTEDYLFGFYNSQARTWDIIANNAPYFLIVKSAGNDRGEGPGNAGQGGEPEKDGGTDGYDCIGGSGNSKNILTVGAVNEVLDYTGPGSVSMSSFSGWGPTDDGRIKPDVVGKGVNVYSSTSGSNTSYSSYNGTSMSAPNVTGTMALLQQLYQESHDDPMRASTLKGLVIHTADEAGSTTGPDYIYGWGLVNAEAAANIIIEDDVMQNSIDEVLLPVDGTYSRDVTVSGGSPLRVTISWTDPHGSVPTASLNPRTPILVHDLDLRVEDEDGNMFFPYMLDPENPSAAATTTTKNNLDNVEMVFLEEAPAGTYTILVNHDGSMNNDQVFSIIISGIDEFTGLPDCSAGLISPLDGADEAFLNHTITWNPAAFSSGYDVYFGTDGEGATPPTNIMNGETITDNFFVPNMMPSTTYYLMVQPRNNLGVNDECVNIYSFTTMPAEANYPYVEGAEEAEHPALPAHWQAMDFGSMEWKTTNLIGYEGDKAFACFTSNGQPDALNNFLISPPFDVENGKEYLVSFAYRSFSPASDEALRMIWGTNADTMDMSANVAFDNPAFGVPNWLMGEALIVPETDDHIFIGFHAYTANGMGMFIDEVMVQDWGPVGVSEAIERQLTVRYANGELDLQSERVFEKLRITATNAAGQMVLDTELNNVQQHKLNFAPDAGVYLIQLQAENMNKTVRLFIQ